MARPEDMRCEVKVGGGRCTGQKSLNPETGDWLRCCEDHYAQEEEARAEGGPRLEWYSPAEEDDEDE